MTDGPTTVPSRSAAHDIDAYSPREIAVGIAKAKMTLGIIVGGGIFIALVYWIIFLRRD